jgi:homoserine kinase
VDHRVAGRYGSVKLLVPASSANLGPGFDALGMALDIHAEFGLVDAATADAELAKRVDEHHPAQVAFAAAGGTGTLWVRSPIPIGRGLGFSGAMRVGGAALAVVERRGPDALVDRRTDVLGVAAALEGHADNVAASLLGGIVATDGAAAVRIDTPLRPDVVLWIPEETTSTSDSRTALPAGVPFDDAVFNVGRTALLVAAFASGDAAALAAATQDRLHQDRRLAAAGMSRTALEAGIAAGAWCGWLSGSGPAVAFLTEGGEGKPLAAALPASGHARITVIDRRGTRLVE